MFFNILHEEISHRFKRWKHSPGESNTNSLDRAKDSLQAQKGKQRRPVENSYSVHFMNFSSPSATASRNFTEETLLSNDVHHRGLSGAECPKNYEEDEVPADAYMSSHGMQNRSEMYSPHPVFPR